MIIKKCKTCNLEKNENDFYKCLTCKFNLSTNCKECSKKKDKIRKDRDKAKISARGKIYREKSPNLKERKRKSYIKNIEKNKAKNKKQYNANKTKCLNQSKKWKEDNPEKIRLYKKKHKENKRISDPAFKIGEAVSKKMRVALKNKGGKNKKHG